MEKEVPVLDLITSLQNQLKSFIDLLPKYKEELEILNLDVSKFQLSELALLNTITDEIIDLKSEIKKFVSHLQPRMERLVKVCQGVINLQTNEISNQMDKIKSLYRDLMINSDPIDQLNKLIDKIHSIEKNLLKLKNSLSNDEYRNLLSQQVLERLKNSNLASSTLILSASLPYISRLTYTTAGLLLITVVYHYCSSNNTLSARSDIKSFISERLKELNNIIVQYLKDVSGLSNICENLRADLEKLKVYLEDSNSQMDINKVIAISDNINQIIIDLNRLVDDLFKY